MTWDAPTITALSVLLATLGGGITWLIRHRDQRKSAVPRSRVEEAAAIANEKSAVEVFAEMRAEIAAAHTMAREAREQSRASEQRSADAERSAAACRAEVSDLAADVDRLRTENDALLDQNVALVDYLLTLTRAVARGEAPPWPSIPDSLRSRITEADLPTFASLPDDGQPADIDDTPPGGTS